jgi:hypothetical protein
MSTILAAVKRGYAYVVQNERGHFFSEGNYDILGSPTRRLRHRRLADEAAVVERQGRHHRLLIDRRIPDGRRALGHPGFAAMNVQGFGAGVGRVGPYYEQGNWYRGGAVQMLFIAWLYGEQNQVRPMFPPNTSQADLIRASKSFDLAQQLPPVDWSQALQQLPVKDIIKNVDGPRGIFETAMPVETGGNMIARTPNDAAWYRGGLGARRHEIQSAGTLVHVLVRRVGRAQPRALQPRPQDRSGRNREPAWQVIASGSSLLVHARHGTTPSSASGAWAMRGSTTTTSSMDFSTSS